MCSDSVSSAQCRLLKYGATYTSLITCIWTTVYLKNSIFDFGYVPSAYVDRMTDFQNSFTGRFLRKLSKYQFQRTPPRLNCFATYVVNLKIQNNHLPKKIKILLFLNTMYMITVVFWYYWYFTTTNRNEWQSPAWLAHSCAAVYWKFNGFNMAYEY